MGSRHGVVLALALALALAITACGSASDSTAQASTTIPVAPTTATKVTTTSAPTASASPTTTTEPAPTTSNVPVVDTGDDSVIDDAEWLELSPILRADDQASFLFDTATQSSVEDAGQAGCATIQANLTLTDLLLAIQNQGKDDQFNNALLAEIKAAMPYICATSFATARA